MRFTVCVNFLKQLVGVSLGGNMNLLLDFLVFIGVGFDVRAVDEHGFGIKVTFVGDFIKNPVEYLVNRFRVESVAEIVAQRGKVRRCFINGTTLEPTIIYVGANFFGNSAQ